MRGLLAGESFPVCGYLELEWVLGIPGAARFGRRGGPAGTDGTPRRTIKRIETRARPFGVIEPPSGYEFTGGGGGSPPGNSMVGGRL